MHVDDAARVEAQQLVEHGGVAEHGAHVRDLARVKIERLIEGGCADYENENLERKVEHINEEGRNVECNDSTSITAHLKKHISGVHQKERNYKCSQCEYSTSQTSHIKMHIKSVHEKERNLK